MFWSLRRPAVNVVPLQRASLPMALIDSAFRKHSAQMKRVLSEMSPEELRSVEVALKKVGKRAATLMEES